MQDMGARTKPAKAREGEIADRFRNHVWHTTVAGLTRALPE